MMTCTAIIEALQIDKCELRIDESYGATTPAWLPNSRTHVNDDDQ